MVYLHYNIITGKWKAKLTGIFNSHKHKHNNNNNLYSYLQYNLYSQ